MAREIILLLGDMLFADHSALPPGLPIVMREDMGFATAHRHHQQKLVLFFSAMRHHAKKLREQGREVIYQELDLKCGDDFWTWLAGFGAETIYTYQPNDPLALPNLPFQLAPSPNFLTDDAQWLNYRLAYPRRLLMADFYSWQRKRLDVMVSSGKPEGGQWSFDAENRKPLPASTLVPSPSWVEPDQITLSVIELVEREFPDHPGEAKNFRYPVTHEQAEAWLADFTSDRLADFGPYEDAISQNERVIFHSVLTPMLNIGLLTPRQILDELLSQPVPIASKEGFVRQVIGWREFIKGVDREYQGKAPQLNGLNNQRELGKSWYVGSTGLPPLDMVIKRARDHAYVHHIERLMVAGAAMLMCDVHPDAAYRWFMEMFIDSADWVMRPNVYGMSQHADGGLFGTKPYVSGSAYLLKMSDFPRGDWCDVWDGLYWRFILRHRETWAANPRMTMAVRAADRLDPVRRERIISLADDFIERNTCLIR